MKQVRYKESLATFEKVSEREKKKNENLFEKQAEHNKPKMIFEPGEVKFTDTNNHSFIYFNYN